MSIWKVFDLLRDAPNGVTHHGLLAHGITEADIEQLVAEQFLAEQFDAVVGLDEPLVRYFLSTGE